MLRKAYKSRSDEAVLFMDPNDSRLLVRMYALLCRYHLLGELKGGYQASITSEVMETLKSGFGVSQECFASPLNRTLTSYNSLFFDTDMYFGSYGSFFKFKTGSGSYEVNPPFDPDTINNMFRQVSAGKKWRTTNDNKILSNSSLCSA